MDKKESIIIVTDFIDNIHCIDSMHGEKIGNRILDLWEQGHIVTLDFEGINLILASFVNSIYGVLSQRYSLEEIRQNLKYDHINDIELLEIKRCERIVSIHNEKNTELRQTVEQLTEGK